MKYQEAKKIVERLRRREVIVETALRAYKGVLLGYRGRLGGIAERGRVVLLSGAMRRDWTRDKGIVWRRVGGTGSVGIPICQIIEIRSGE